MTVAKLHKFLSEMIAQGHGRRQILVNKSTFVHPLEADGCVLMDVYGVIPHTCGYLNGDGFRATRKDGSECRTSCVLIYGTAGDPATGLKEEFK